METGLLSFGLAFLGGLVSFASPCVLPLVPSFLGFIAGNGATSPRMTRTLFFILGFSLVFVLLGVVFSVGSLALGGALPVIRAVSGLVVILFAVQMVFPFLPFLNYEKRAHVTKRPVNGLEAILVGMAFGAGWTPCIGPMLSAILLLAGADKTVGSGALLLVLYSLGLGIPFLVVSIWMDRFKPLMAWMRRRSRLISWAGALLMFAMGVLILSGQFTAMPRLMVQWGSQLQEWSASNESQGLSHIVATAIYSLLLLAPSLWHLASGMKRGRLSKIGASFSGLGIVLGGSLLVAEWAGAFPLLPALGTWLLFQGL